MARKAFLIVLFAALGLVAKMPIAYSGKLSPVEKTWFMGTYIFPEDFTKSGSRETFQKSEGEPVWTDKASEVLKKGVQVPAVLYMHGCKGFSNQGKKYRDLLLGEGFAFFMPDSFQRPGRKECGKQGQLEERVAMRNEELEFAYKEIQKLPWVDKKRLVLMGFSEGGNTVDSWSKPGFAAHLIMSSACTLVGGIVAAPPETPVLAIVGEKDDYRPGLSCKVDRTIKGSKSIVISGKGHSIAQYRKTKNAIKVFLKECCSQ